MYDGQAQEGQTAGPADRRCFRASRPAAIFRSIRRRRTARRDRKAASNSGRGFTLLETMIAITVLFIAASGALALFGISVMQSSAVGDRGTRTTEYAQDKMEQLLTTTFSDATTDFTQNPPVSGSSCCGLAAGGSLDPANPVTGYVDYVSANGTPGPSSTGAFYIREWLITNDSNSPPQIKTITVVVKQISATVGPIVPSTTLISQKCSSTDN